VRELQTFLGRFNFYRRFILKATAIVRLLTDALRGTLAPRRHRFLVGGDGDSALLDHPFLHRRHFFSNRDALASHIVAVLQQQKQFSSSQIFLAEVVSCLGKVQHFQ
jgi:hypothetical protein